MKIESFTNGMFAENCYIAIDEAANEAVIIDQLYPSALLYQTLIVPFSISFKACFLIQIFPYV